MKARFKFDTSTKGAHRFDEVDDDDNVKQVNGESTVVGKLYIRKTAMADAPKYIEITIETAEE